MKTVAFNPRAVADLEEITFTNTPKLHGIGEAMREMIAKNEVAGRSRCCLGRKHWKTQAA